MALLGCSAAAEMKSVFAIQVEQRLYLSSDLKCAGFPVLDGSESRNTSESCRSWGE
jgi:hypothetical protein